MRVGLVIPVLNNFQGACELLASVKTHHQVQVYVQPQWRAQVPLAAAWNTGAYRAFEDGCDYVLISNDDVMLAPYCIDYLIDELKRLAGERVIMTTANNVLGQLAGPDDILTYERDNSTPMVSDHPNFACFMIGRGFFDKAGSFDENFNQAWWEDNDMHYRIHLLGYRAVSTTAAPCVHIGQVTSRLTPASSVLSQSYFVRKWGSGNRNLDEAFKTPYNDPELTPKDWRAA